MHRKAIDMAITARRTECRQDLVDELGNSQRRKVTEHSELVHGDGCMIYRTYKYPTGKSNLKVSEITLPQCRFLEL